MVHYVTLLVVEEGAQFYNTTYWWSSTAQRKPRLQQEWIDTLPPLLALELKGLSPTAWLSCTLIPAPSQYHVVPLWYGMV